MSLGNDTWLELPNTDKLRTCMRHCSELGHLYAAIQVRPTKQNMSGFIVQNLSDIPFYTTSRWHCGTPLKIKRSIRGWIGIHCLYISLMADMLRNRDGVVFYSAVLTSISFVVYNRNPLSIITTVWKIYKKGWCRFCSQTKQNCAFHKYLFCFDFKNSVLRFFFLLCWGLKINKWIVSYHWKVFWRLVRNSTCSSTLKNSLLRVLVERPNFM